MQPWAMHIKNYKLSHTHNKVSVANKTLVRN